MSSTSRPVMTDANGIRKTLNAGNWNDAFGGSIDSFKKAFTTQIDYTGGVSTWVRPTGSNSGFANASGLNPYGYNTVGEGIFHSKEISPSSFVTINPTGVRHHGYKNPATFVGWGFDIHGQPWPNANSGYNISGRLGTVTPTGLFHAASGLNQEIDFASVRGSDVPERRFFSGPLDLRIDPQRGVWTIPFGVKPCMVIGASVAGDTNPTGAYVANTIRYDVVVEDGEADKLTLTGIPNYGTHYTASGYYVKVLPTGSRAFLMNATISGMPKIVLWASEPLAISGCGTDITVSPILTKAPNVTLDTDTFDNFFILGSGDTTIASKEFIPGTGLSVSYTSTTWHLNLSGVATILGGVNSNINALSGLTVPLSVSQGGTGASGLNFVALTGTQTASGIKIWQNQARFNNGSLVNPALTVGSNAIHGLAYFGESTGIAIVNSGSISANFTTLQSNFNKKTFFQVTSGSDPALTVKVFDTGTDFPFVVQDSLGNTNFSAGISGCKIHAISGSTKITIPPATSGNSILVLPSGGTVVNTSYLQQSFVWNEVPSGLVNGVNRNFLLTKQPLTSGTAMVFRNGIMQEYGATQDYTVSGFTVIFTTGSIPNSGVDKIRVSYQATGIY